MASKFIRKGSSLPIVPSMPSKPKPKKKKNTNGTLALTPSEKIFADEWLEHRNATKAYRVAYPHIKTMSGCASMGSTLLKKLKVDRYVQKHLDKLSATSRLNTEWVLKRYEMLADYCISDFFNDDGSMKPFSEIPKEKLYAIGGFKQEKKTITTKDKRHITNCVKEFKLADKKGSVDSVAKYLKLFDDGGSRDRGINIETINVQFNVVDDDGQVIS